MNKISFIEKHKESSPKEATTAYFNEIAASTSLLTAKEEIQLGRLVQLGDLAAKNRMITSNLRLVVKIVKQYRLYAKGLDFIDAVSEGNFGLIRAVEKFNPELGFRFSTYATHWIKQSIERGVYNGGSIVRTPIHIQKEINAYYHAVRELCKDLEHEPSQEEVADFLDRPVEDIKRLLTLSQKKFSSLDVQVEGSNHSLVDTMCDDNNECYEDIQLNERVTGLLSYLNENERLVICMRFGLCGYDILTLDEVGDQIKLTRERVRQIQISALKKLEKIALANNIDSSLISAAS